MICLDKMGLYLDSYNYIISFDTAYTPSYWTEAHFYYQMVPIFWVVTSGYGIYYIS